MSDRLKALRQERGQIVTEMRGILDKAEAEKRSPTAEETAKHAELFARQEERRGAIEAEERQVELDREMAGAAAEEERAKAKGGEGAPEKATPDLSGFRKYLLGNASQMTADERRALEATDDPSGGYLVGPEVFVRELLKGVDDMVFMRQRATKHMVANADSLGVPTLTADPSDAEWTTELLTGSDDSTMNFGKRSLTPHPLAKRIKVSNTLLRRSVLPAEAIVRDRFAYKFAITEEKAYLTGDGTGKPLGVFTASADGITTAQDVSTGNTSTTIEADGLISAKMAMKAQYWSRCDWLFHRDAVAQISKLKDGEGQYLWRMGMREGESDMLLGRPLMISEYAPNTFTSGLYVGLLGDFSYYWIADALDMQVQRLVELYAETNQVGFIGRRETDGMPVLAEAFRRVKLG